MRRYQAIGPGSTSVTGRISLIVPASYTYGYVPAPYTYGYVPAPYTYGYVPAPYTYGAVLKKKKNVTGLFIYFVKLCLLMAFLSVSNNCSGSVYLRLCSGSVYLRICSGSVYLRLCSGSVYLRLGFGSVYLRSCVTKTLPGYLFILLTMFTNGIPFSIK